MKTKRKEKEKKRRKEKNRKEKDHAPNRTHQDLRRTQPKLTAMPR